MNPFGRLIHLCTPDWSKPLTGLEARAISDVARGTHPHRPQAVAVEEIRPGDPLWLFNAADPSCENCNGMGRVSVREIDGDRCWLRCECVDPGRCAP